MANPEGKKQLPSKRFEEMTSGKTQLNGIIHPTTQPLGEWIELSGEPFEIFELK